MDSRQRYSPSTPAGGAVLSAVASSRTQQTASTLPLGRVLFRGYSVWKHRAFFWCLDLGAASLVPLCQKNPLFNMFTMAARSHTVLGCLRCCSFSFPLLLLAQNVFTVCEMLMIMLSVWCVHGEKKNYTKDEKEIKSIKCLQVLCRGREGG